MVAALRRRIDRGGRGAAVRRRCRGYQFLEVEGTLMESWRGIPRPSSTSRAVLGGSQNRHNLKQFKPTVCSI